MIYLTILFTFAFIFYSKYQFSDDRGTSQGKWHWFGPAIRMAPFVIAFLCQLFPSPWQDYILAGAICIWVFEIGINKIALNKSWFYVGTEAATDKKLGKKKWFVFAAILLAAVAIKIFT